jgi:hypothetical protein
MLTGKRGGFSRLKPEVASGKHTQNYGKSPFFMGKSTINIYKWPFSIAMLVYQK